MHKGAHIGRLCTNCALFSLYRNLKPNQLWVAITEAGKGLAK